MKDKLTREEILFIEILKSYIIAGGASMPLTRDLIGYTIETYNLALTELNGIKLVIEV